MKVVVVIGALLILCHDPRLRLAILTAPPTQPPPILCGAGIAFATGTSSSSALERMGGEVPPGRSDSSAQAYPA